MMIEREPSRSPVIPLLGRLHATFSRFEGYLSSGVFAGLDVHMSTALVNPRSLITTSPRRFTLRSAFRLPAFWHRV